jgi:hypothetical protein
MHQPLPNAIFQIYNCHIELSYEKKFTRWQFQNLAPKIWSMTDGACYRFSGK